MIYVPQLAFDTQFWLLRKATQPELMSQSKPLLVNHHSWLNVYKTKIMPGFYSLT